jgi:hypothetical protein
MEKSDRFSSRASRVPKRPDLRCRAASAIAASAVTMKDGRMTHRAGGSLVPSLRVIALKAWRRPAIRS